MTRYALGIDVGGTKVAGGIVDSLGNVVTRVGRPSDAEVASVAVELLAEADRLGLKVEAIGAGYPEYVSADGRLTSNMVLPWAYRSVEQLSALGLPLVVESDVRAGALAEARFGGGVSAHSMFYVSLGTGVSTTFVVEQTAWAGHRGEALALGEFDVPLRPLVGRADWSTLVSEAVGGNLEQFCSGAGIAARYSARTGSVVGGAREVIEVGDNQAVEVLTSAGLALGTALASAVSLIDPELVILGGGLGCTPGILRDSILTAYGQRCAARPGIPPLMEATCGADSGMIGAAVAALW